MARINMKNKNNNEGYAILFTVVIVSAISVVTAGLSNAIYKQLILSSLAKDSQVAFYQSDTATDCALYADRVKKQLDPTFGTINNATWSCGGVTNVVSPILPEGSYKIYPPSDTENSNNPCFRIEVNVDTTDPLVKKTTILSKGYNICNKTNIRTVEREIKIYYEE